MHRRTQNRLRRLTILILAGLIVWSVPGCGTGRRVGPPLVVGMGTGDVPALLVEMTLLLLTEHGYQVEVRDDLATAGVRAAYDEGEIDLFWADTAVVWADHLRHHQPIRDPQELYALVAEEDGVGGLRWVGPAPLRSGHVLVMSETRAAASNLRSISDLVRYRQTTVPRLSLCSPPELVDSIGGVRGVERVYGLSFDRALLRRASVEDGYAAAASGACEVAMGRLGDAGIGLLGLRVLVDDQGFFPVSSLALGVRVAHLDQHAELEGLLARFVQDLDAREFQRLEMQVYLDQIESRAAARSYLRRNDLLPDWADALRRLWRRANAGPGEG